jgi:hypothetical protein
MHQTLVAHGLNQHESFLPCLFGELFSMEVIIMIGTNYAFPKGRFVDAQNLFWIRRRNQLLAHTHETRIASNII